MRPQNFALAKFLRHVRDLEEFTGGRSNQFQATTARALADRICSISWEDNWERNEAQKLVARIEFVRWGKANVAG